MNGEPFLELNNIQSRKMIAPKTCADNYATNNGSIPRFIYGTPKW